MATNNGEFNEKPPFMRPAEVARAIGCSKSKVYELVRAGELPARKFGMSIRIPRAAIEKMAAELTDQLNQRERA